MFGDPRYERLRDDLYGEVVDVALVVRKKDGTEVVAARMPNATVVMEMASEINNYGYESILRSYASHQVRQIRVTTDQEFYMYQPDYFRGKPANEIDPPRKEIEK